MHSLASVIVALVLGPGLPMQEGTPAQKESTAAQQSEVERRLEALNTEYMKIMEDWQAALRAEAEEARKAGKEPPAASDPPPVKPLLEKVMALAQQFEGSEDAVSVLTYALFMGVSYDPPTAGKAADLLTEKYAASPKMADLGPMFPNLESFIGAEKSKALMAALEAQNKDPDVLGWLLVYEHGSTIASADLKSPEYLAARAALMAAAEKISNPMLQQTIRNSIEEREKFGLGSVAPDIVGVDLDGVDLDGVAFKLSDYKGKVVFLDFWGDW